MRLLVYGLGRGADECRRLVRKEHEIIGYMDSLSHIKRYNARPFFPLCAIRELSFEYVIVTVCDLEAVRKICSMLVEEYGLPSEKIIVFWYVQNRELWRCKLETYKLEEIETIICGNSHATFAFLEEAMERPAINLATPANDLFYIKWILEKCMSEAYRNRFRRIRNIVIDLYDYNYFNVDVVRGSTYPLFLERGGVLAEDNGHGDYRKFAAGCESCFDQAVMDLIFELDHKPLGSDWHEYDRWTHIGQDEYGAMGEQIMTSHVVNRRFEVTIKENKELLSELLVCLRKWKPDVNIIFTLCPRYITMEKKGEMLLGTWREEFEMLIEGYCRKFDACYRNYKGHSEISENHCFYYDVAHFNTVGGKAFTEILNEDLKGI